MKLLAWWMRAVAVLYLLQFVVAVVIRVPIQVLAPPGTLERAASGDGTAKLLVDTWVLFGLDLLVVAGSLIAGSRAPERSRPIILIVIAFELVRGIGHDLYMLSRGYDPTGLVVWIAIHIIVIGTGSILLRRSPPA